MLQLIASSHKVLLQTSGHKLQLPTSGHKLLLQTNGQMLQLQTSGQTLQVPTKWFILILRLELVYSLLNNKAVMLNYLSIELGDRGTYDKIALVRQPKQM